MHGPGAAAVDPRPGVRDPPRVPLGAVGAHARGRGHRAGRRSGGDGGRGMSGARGGGRVAPPLGERAAAAAAAAAGGGGEEAAPVSALEVVSFLGKLLCAVAALKAALYLLRRVCLAMAWKSGGASHSELIHNLRKNGIIKTDKVFEVMLATDRCHYAKYNPYMDSPQSIGFQATISAPHMHAYALELLSDQLHEGAKALDVGSGSGILTACFSRMWEMDEWDMQKKLPMMQSMLELQPQLCPKQDEL
ncbi:protein-L-isoaspartate(D-aspartate) O-methyltransferase isoform 5-T5 [Geothlypis trichas]